MTDASRWSARGLLAVPEYPHGDGEQRDWLGQRVQAALAVEVGGLAEADVLLFRVRFGQGRIDAALELRSAASTPAVGSLGSVASVSRWQELAGDPELAGLAEYARAGRARPGLAAGARWDRMSPQRSRSPGLMPILRGCSSAATRQACARSGSFGSPTQALTLPTAARSYLERSPVPAAWKRRSSSCLTAR